MQQAEQFKPQLEGQQQEVDKAWTQQKSTSDKVREARKQLNEIGDHLEKVQPSDSPIAQARVRYGKAQLQYEQSLKRILESAEYKEVFQAALDTGDREKASDVRSSFVKGNVELSGLLLELKTSRQAYEDLRKSLIEGHPDHQRLEQAQKNISQQIQRLQDRRNNLR